MRYVFVLAALVSGLILNPTEAVAHKSHRIKLVWTVMSISVTDRNNQPLYSPDGVTQAVLMQFGNLEWAKAYWDTMTVGGGAGESLVPTRFPVDSIFIQRMKMFSGMPLLSSMHKISVGFSLIDGSGRPLHSEFGVRIMIGQIGVPPWPRNLKITIEGELDERGYILAQVAFPLNKEVINNFELMAKSQGQYMP